MINEETNKFKLNEEQKSRLFNLGIDSQQSAESTSTVPNKTDLMFEIMAAPLPVDPKIVDSLPVILRPLWQELRTVFGEPLGKILQNPATNISLLKKIKNYAKSLGTSPHSKSEITHDIALVIYYAAIAGALLFHDQKITKNTYNELENTFLSLTKQSWIPQDLIDHFLTTYQQLIKKRGT